MEKKIENLVKELLAKLEVKPESLTVSQPVADSYQVSLQLSPQETGILIGYHGDTISSLQLILNLLLYKQEGKWFKLIVNIGDYREKRLEAVQKLAQDAAQKVKFSGQPLALFNLNPFERHTIHELFSSDPEITTESEGEGRNRHLIVKPRI